MKLGLVQTKHEPMYDFLRPPVGLTAEQCRAQQSRQVEQNLSLLAGAEGQGYDLLVTTECVNYVRIAWEGCYPALDSGETQAFSEAARRARSWLVAGLAFRENGSNRNGALIFDRDGELRQVYRKTHLAGDEGEAFAPGDCLCVQDADFGRFGVAVCWDMQFPEVARTLALRGAQLVACPTWGWEAGLYGRARAYENGIFAAAAMAVPAWGPIEAPRTPSSVVGPDGEMLACGSADAAALVSCSLDLSRTAEYRAVRLESRRPELYFTQKGDAGHADT